jgi:ABC-type multidrug transport system ATPase subunit
VNEGKYLNDGTLRLIAILSQLQSKQSFLLFDEIENGINSELIEFLLDTLIASNHQVMITTHSPMILNYIDDETAIKSVNYIYKTEEGFTKSIPFFSIPSMKEKLELMGTGEVYVDTNLSNLHEDIKLIEAQKETKEDK